MNDAASLFLAPSSLHGGRETCKNCESRKGKTRAAEVVLLRRDLPVTPSVPWAPRGPGQSSPSQQVTGGASAAQSSSMAGDAPARGSPCGSAPRALCPARWWCGCAVLQVPPGEDSAAAPEQSTPVSNQKLFQSLVGPGLSPKERRKWVWGGICPFLALWVKAFKTLLTSPGPKGAALLPQGAPPSPGGPLRGPHQPAPSLLLLRALSMLRHLLRRLHTSSAELQGGTGRCTV